MPAGVDAKRAALVGDGHAALATVGGRHGYPEPLLRVLARLAHAQLQRAASEEREEAAATVSSAESARAAPPAPAAQLQPLLAVMREALAEQVFPPRELADYDRVVPLPLATAHDTTPARLAVAQRTTASGQRATFIRVDAELSALGPVSVRLSGADGGGPIAITLVAGAAAAAALAEELPSLVADLRQLGLDAAVRVVSDA
ncbi:MAG: hypothetical protein RMM29_09655 [Planctomycetota bacterium]|nr:hypothetical protein [Planctomycetota bacterium]MDW8373894.1 hypothetical protein [Planctomycetota bacterium]